MSISYLFNTLFALDCTYYTLVYPHQEAKHANEDSLNFSLFISFRRHVVA
jgi:hypothetical protein